MKHWTEYLIAARKERDQSVDDAQAEQRANECILAEKALRQLIQSVKPTARIEVEHDLKQATISAKMPDGAKVEFGFYPHGETRGLFMHGECPRCGMPSISETIRDWYALAKLIENFEPNLVHICPRGPGEPSPPISGDTHDFLMLSAEHAREAYELKTLALESIDPHNIDRVEDVQAVALISIASQLSALHLHLDALTQYDKLTDTASLSVSLTPGKERP